MFRVPTGSTGRAFVAELAHLIQSFADGAAIEPFVLKSLMVMPALLLQKPSVDSKLDTHLLRSCLQRRLDLWLKGEFMALFNEGLVIQTRISSRPPYFRCDDQHHSGRFAHLMMEGRVNAALRCLALACDCGPLSLDHVVGSDGSSKTVYDVLKDKHPLGRAADPALVLDVNESSVTFHPVLFDGLDAALIRSVALQISGAAGPSGADARSWRLYCTSFGSTSADLCHAISAFGHRICTSYVDPTGLTAYTACRLIPLDKNPGVRPIGVGEVLRRIVGRAVMRIARQDLLYAAGSSQLCAGQIRGCEAAVHAMKQIFSSPSVDGVLLVDATNAFNELNRQVTLRNVEAVCPVLAPILVNTYRQDASLFTGGHTIFSSEGTTQGDPLAMAMYAIGTLPLIDKLQGIAWQCWYADDSAAGGNILNLKRWWDLLQVLGPWYGYFPNGTKSWLVVKEDALDSVREVFDGTDIHITTEGHRYVGGVIGSEAFEQQFLQQKVQDWISDLRKLSVIAESQPHAAYSACSRGLSFRWNYFFGFVPSLLACSNRWKILLVQFSYLGYWVVRFLDKSNVIYFSLPIRLGGLGLFNPTVTAISQHACSLHTSSPLVDLIVSQIHDASSCFAIQIQLRSEVLATHRKELQEFANNIYDQLPSDLQSSVELACERGASNWLSCLPLRSYGFALHKSAFRDGLLLRYHWTPPACPTSCACGHDFTIDHCISCPKGGFPSLRHNEVRDLTAKMMSEVCNNVSIEPRLQPLSGEALRFKTANSDSNARLDIAANGFWGGRFERPFFDVRVFNPGAPSNHPFKSAYRRHEREKRRQYEQRVREVEHGHFTPLVFTTTGGMGR